MSSIRRAITRFLNPCEDCKEKISHQKRLISDLHQGFFRLEGMVEKLEVELKSSVVTIDAHEFLCTNQIKEINEAVKKGLSSGRKTRSNIKKSGTTK